nr:AraC family transcriptional regulator [Antrihabitans stalactiti]
MLADLGIAVVNVLRRAGLPQNLLSGGPAVVGPVEYFAFWQALDDEADDPDLAFRIGRAMSAEVFAPSLFAALCSPNLAVAAGRIAVYKKLIGPMRVHVTSTRDSLAVEYEWPGALQPPDLLIVTELAFWVALARLGTRSAISPTRVSAPVQQANSASATSFFGVGVDHRAVQSITFSAVDAVRPFLTANDEMWQFFEPELRKRLSELDDAATMTERVRAAFHEMLPAGTASMAELARELAVSTRTLQRQLQAESTTFRAVLNHTREALARHYLLAGNLSVPEIAFLLGYNDTNSFYRAFNAWTGTTPEQLRMFAV